MWITLLNAGLGLHTTGSKCIARYYLDKICHQSIKGSVYGALFLKQLTLKNNSNLLSHFASVV